MRHNTLDLTLVNESMKLPDKKNSTINAIGY